jgi:galactokinase/mevalonate kinase-like predicted kinase
MRLADVIGASFRENVAVHESTTNPHLDALLGRVRHWTRGVKLLGAGGGGYALFVSDTAAAADRLKEMLRVEFEDDRARVVDFALNKRGIEVTVS